MSVIRMPEHKLQWLRFQDYTRLVSRQNQASAEQAQRHYEEPASRQLQLTEEYIQRAEYQSLVTRLGNLMQMDLDRPLSNEAVSAARKVIADIVVYMFSHISLTAPSVFATNDGRVSFEWQPNKTGGDTIGSILLSANGQTADFQIERCVGAEIEVVLSEEDSDLSRINLFLQRLVTTIGLKRTTPGSAVEGGRG